MIHRRVVRMAAARCCLLILAAGAASTGNDTRRMHDRRLMVGFGLDDKIGLVLDDVVHAVPRT